VNLGTQSIACIQVALVCRTDGVAGYRNCYGLALKGPLQLTS
jgi:hypothetical protein